MLFSMNHHSSYLWVLGWHECMSHPLVCACSDMLDCKICTPRTTECAAGSYKMIMSSQAVSIHPSSVLSGKKARCIVFGELIHTTRNYARQVTAIDPAWLPELAPSVFTMRLQG